IWAPIHPVHAVDRSVDAAKEFFGQHPNSLRFRTNYSERLRLGHTLAFTGLSTAANETTERIMQRVCKPLVAAVLCAASANFAFGSSHREALTVLNEPCADNTDTYAWVSNGAHSKLYLIMNFNPLHEPGQGNQGLRACNGYRYEFHIARGSNLRDYAV